MFFPLSLALLFTPQVLALPQITYITIWPPLTPTPTPTLSTCGVLSSSPPCPIGYKCQPYVTRLCPEVVGTADLCGFCTNTQSPSTTPTLPTTSSKASGGAAPTTTCPSGFTPDYRFNCRKTSTASLSNATPFTCPAGFTPDYRGISFCRPTYQRTTSLAASSSSSWVEPLWTTTSVRKCEPGFTVDYRGVCRAVVGTT